MKPPHASARLPVGMLEVIRAAEWDFGAAAHLLNRAGFGGTPDQIEALQRQGPEAAVDGLLDYRRVEAALEPPAWAKPDPERAERLRKARTATAEERAALRREEQSTQRSRTLELRRWWVTRMATTARPLEERMVLFWHGHFATSIQKVRDAWLMYRQLATFREHATGHWPTLLMAVTRDPAMLVWLDQARSRRDHPNENYAREVMELFALGEGNYGEPDVLEAARALTGLGYDPVTQEPVWRPRQHDAGPKSVLGNRGRLDPEGVIRVIAEHPQSGRFLARKLWGCFAGVPATAAQVEALNAAFVGGRREISALLRTLLLSRDFYAPEVRRVQIKSPVQWLAMALRQLDRPVPRPELVTSVLRELGQELLAPPNVKGWDDGVAWINTGTLTRRRQYAALLVDGLEAAPGMVGGERGARLGERLARRRGGPPGRGLGAIDVERLFSAEERRDRSRLETALERRFLQARFRPRLAEDVRSALGEDRTPDSRAVARAVRVVVESTDYQLT